MTNAELDAKMAAVMGWGPLLRVVQDDNGWEHDGTFTLQSRWHPSTDARDTDRVMERLFNSPDIHSVTISRDVDDGLEVEILAVNNRRITFIDEDNEVDWKRAVCLVARGAFDG